MQYGIGAVRISEAFFTFDHSTEFLLGHPMDPGPTSAIEKGPWHYGADYVASYFEGDPSKLRDLLPVDFEVDDGRCMAYVCEIVSIPEGDPEAVATHPDRTLYHEAALGIGCRFGAVRGIFFPVMWVTTEWSLLRGLLNGYQKRLADKIYMTKLHPLNPGLKPLGPGTKLSGFCIKGLETTLSLEVTIENKGTSGDLPSFGRTFGLRMFPRTAAAQSEVREPVEILKSNAGFSDVWLGTASLETTLDVGTPKHLKGSFYRGGFTISGSKPLRR